MGNLLEYFYDPSVSKPEELSSKTEVVRNKSGKRTRRNNIYVSSVGDLVKMSQKGSIPSTTSNKRQTMHENLNVLLRKDLPFPSEGKKKKKKNGKRMKLVVRRVNSKGKTYGKPLELEDVIDSFTSNRSSSNGKDKNYRFQVKRGGKESMIEVEVTESISQTVVLEIPYSERTTLGEMKKVVFREIAKMNGGVDYLRLSTPAFKEFNRKSGARFLKKGGVGNKNVFVLGCDGYSNEFLQSIKPKLKGNPDDFVFSQVTHFEKGGHYTVNNLPKMAEVDALKCSEVKDLCNNVLKLEYLKCHKLNKNENEYAPLIDHFIEVKRGFNSSRGRANKGKRCSDLFSDISKKSNLQIKEFIKNAFLDDPDDKEDYASSRMENEKLKKQILSLKKENTSLSSHALLLREEINVIQNEMKKVKKTVKKTSRRTKEKRDFKSTAQKKVINDLTKQNKEYAETVEELQKKLRDLNIKELQKENILLKENLFDKEVLIISISKKMKDGFARSKIRIEELEKESLKKTNRLNYFKKRTQTLLLQKKEWKEANSTI